MGCYNKLGICWEAECRVSKCPLLDRASECQFLDKVGGEGTWSQVTGVHEMAVKCFDVEAAENPDILFDHNVNSEADKWACKMDKAKDA